MTVRRPGKSLLVGVAAGRREFGSTPTSRRRLPRPNRRQIEIQRLERRHACRSRAAPGAEQLEPTTGQYERFERLQSRVTQPDVWHVFTRIERQLLHAVERSRGGGQDFGDPVGREVESGGVGDFWHARSAPTGQVGDEDVRAQVKLGLVENDPATRAAAATVEGIADDHPEQRCDGRVGSARAGVRVKLAANDFANNVTRQLEEVVVRGTARGDVCHDLAFRNVARRERKGAHALRAKGNGPDD
jgi:hypothetical protein